MISREEKAKCDAKKIYCDFLVLADMSCHIKIKIKMLGQLVGAIEDHWRVVGITKEAFDVFKENDFKRATKMNIQRAHLVQRKMTFEYLLTNKPQFDEWWKYFWPRDVVVLATVKQNKIIENIESCYAIDEGLFLTKGFAWRHDEATEGSFLRALKDKLDKVEATEFNIKQYITDLNSNIIPA